jgi:hypothetical protein
MSMRLLPIVVFLMAAVPAAAQSTGPSRPTAAVEVIGGYAGFIDESFVDHTVVGASARIHLSPRISVGPEVVYMRGPGFDRDLFVTGNLTFDLLVLPVEARRGTVNPFLVVGAGLMRHSDRFGTTTFASSEGAVTGGGGLRVWLTDRVYALGEFRLGWEPHYRVTGGIGVRWR